VCLAVPERNHWVCPIIPISSRRPVAERKEVGKNIVGEEGRVRVPWWHSSEFFCNEYRFLDKETVIV